MDELRHLLFEESNKLATYGGMSQVNGVEINNLALEINRLLTKIEVMQEVL